MRLKTFIGKAYRRLLRELLRKFKHFRYKAWLSVKQISLKGRKKKIRVVEEILNENPNIYFTTDLVKTGFTDQLIGFNFLYKMGRGLGLKYVHTPLSARRSSDPFLYDSITQKKQSPEQRREKFEDIFDFLGVNEHMEKKSKTVPQRPKTIYLNLNVTLFGTEGVDSYEALLEEMKVILYSFLKKNRAVILCFFVEPKTYFHYYRHLCDRKEHEIDFHHCFKSRKSRWSSEFTHNSTNMLVHIRQGDTGTVETPWNTFIPVWDETVGNFTQFQNERDIPGHKRIYPEQFYQFVKDFQGESGIKPLSTVVFSDGYKKTFRWIYKYSKRKDISPEEIKKLKKLEPTYDKAKFGKFNDLKNTKTVIGEEVDKLYSLVESFLDADIIVTGTQAVMMPKFMASYGKKDRMPFLVVLYHTRKSHLDYIGFKDSDPFLMFVNINSYDISEVVKRSSEYLKSRRKADF